MKNESNIIIYQGKNGRNIDVRVESETIWLNLNQISDLFDKVNKKLQNPNRQKWIR